MDVRRFLNNIEEIAAGAGLVLVMAITAYNIFNRYVLEQSAVWAPELAGILYAWVVFLGASAAWKRNMHIGIDVIVRHLPPRGRQSIRILSDMVLIAFLAYTTYLAVSITISAQTRVSPVMRVPYSYVYASAAIGFALMLVRRMLSLAQALRRPASSPRL